MPSPASVERAVELLRLSANYQYFFEKLDTPDWVEPLYERGFFQYPPQPIHEGDYVRLPIWVESRYLVRVAAQVPDLVVQIFSRLPETENTRVHEDIVDALCNVPAGLAVSLSGKVAEFLDSPYQMLLPEKVRDLCLGWVRAGQLQPAVDVARALLLPIGTEAREVAGFNFPPEARPRFTFPDYGEVLREILAAIADVDPLSEFALAAGLLDRVLSIGQPADRSEDFSYIWREAIEAGVREGHRDMRDDLIDAVRDARAWDTEDIARLLGDLEAMEWPVCRRLALHEIRTHAAQVPELVRNRVLDADRLFDPSTYHEHVLLVRDAMPELSDEEASFVLQTIEAGPAVDEGRADGEHDRRTYWVYRTLAALRPSLPADGLELLERVRSQLGFGDETLVDADFLTESSGGVWVGPTSPLDVEDLLAMPDAEVLAFLASWEAPDEWRAPSPEGLGRVLQGAVERDPRRFSRIASDFVGIGPTYVRALIQGLREASRKELVFEWPAVLRLCIWVVTQEDHPPARHDRDRDPDWSWARRALASLLREGLAISDGSIPLAEREVVWEILSQLTEDADPTPQHEEQYGGSNMDPVTLALNTVRGEALGALVRYVLWVRAGIDEGDRAGLGDMPEAQRTLERHLDPSVDPSLAVRSVYGQFFPWLHLVDAGWAEANLRMVFPDAPELREWFDAAWDAYIVFTQPFDRMADVMNSAYRQAIERLPELPEESGSRERPEERLAEHLAVFIARGVLDRHDPLVERFFELAPPRVRGHVHEFLGRSFREVPPPEDVADRAMSLWAERVETCLASESDETDELTAFGWWFIARRIDPGWRMANLLTVLRKTHGRISFASAVLEQLAIDAEDRPRDALEAAELIVRGAADQGWEILAGRDHIRSVLLIGLRSDAESQSLATTLAHELGARGYSEFRSVLDQA